MISTTTKRFRKAYAKLPIHIQKSSKKAYRLWKENPYHPSLHFKQIHKKLPIYSVRIALAWRTVGIKQDDKMIWFWIGSHADYDKLIAI